MQSEFWRTFVCQNVVFFQLIHLTQHDILSQVTVRVFGDGSLNVSTILMYLRALDRDKDAVIHSLSAATHENNEIRNAAMGIVGAADHLVLFSDLSHTPLETRTYGYAKDPTQPEQEIRAHQQKEMIAGLPCKDR